MKLRLLVPDRCLSMALYAIDLIKALVQCSLVIDR